MTDARTDTLRRYVDGEIAAERAADLLGIGTTVTELILKARALSGRPPDRQDALTRGEYRRVLGLARPASLP